MSRTDDNGRMVYKCENNCCPGETYFLPAVLWNAGTRWLCESCWDGAFISPHSDEIITRQADTLALALQLRDVINDLEVQKDKDGDVNSTK